MDSKRDGSPTWGWRRAHCGARCLMAENISEFEVVVFKDDRKCFNECICIAMLDPMFIILDVLGDSLEARIFVGGG